jgi:hypothetical protein
LDELNLLRAKLYKAKAEGKMEKVLDEDDEEEIKKKEEQILIAAEQNDDLDIERPVDVKAFEALKIYRNKLKSENIEWINTSRGHIKGILLTKTSTPLESRLRTIIPATINIS